MYERQNGDIRTSAHQDLGKTLEHPLRNGKDFLDDNQSPEAETARNKWIENYRHGNIFLIWRCSDARPATYLPPELIIDVSTIATCGPRTPYQRILQYPQIKGIINLTHLDGSDLNEHTGFPNVNCGGQFAFANLEELKTEAPANGHNALRFVGIHVDYEDAIKQSIESLMDTGLVTQTEQAAGAIDHVTGDLYINTALINNGRELRSKLSIPHIMQKTLTREMIYENGIPNMKWSQFSPDLQKFIEAQQEHVTKMMEEYPDLHSRQKKQNRVEFVVVTTEKIPIRNRYPHLSAEPGSFFQVHIPRYKNEAIVHINDEDISLAIDQTHYAISNAVKNHDDPEKSFSRAQTLLIETGDIAESGRITKAFLENKWMQEFLSFTNHQVFFSQTRSGRTSQIVEI